ncbi:heme biosynthesis HemY N-terminal domain-containing protein [Shewanella holmiensis]|uniref:Heme biosynthesis protein HemY n=1 Tax=Shewanella holmiensis TaxID=2952222 RepID=A0A9X2WPS1_9GAMM|nr:heme biosynthesis HemY N-terminal domain-containing protein [Shewanella holmiensis]MCT7943090.1 heme biosynthesis protein HemY [Shewanella holmiensis]
MIKLLAYVLIIVLGLCLTPYLLATKGYIYIAIWDYQIETSLAFGLLVLFAIFVSFEVIKKALVFVLTLVLNSRFLPERWRIKKAKKQTLIGALALAEEDWPAAEKAMAKGAENGELPALNYFAAARAAQHQHKIAERDRYLSQAQAEPLAKAAALTTRTRYLLQQGELTQARALLDELEPTSKSKNPILKIAADLYLAQQDWPALKSLLPILAKRHIYPEEQLQKISVQTNVQLVNKAAEQTSNDLDKCWGWFSKSEKNQTDTFIAYLYGLCKLQRKDEALKLLSKQLKSNPKAALFDATAVIATAHDQDIRKSLAKLEHTHENVVNYQESLAKLALQTREFKQAKMHFNNACHIEPTRTRWLALAQVQEQLGDNIMALQSYRNAAHLND